MTQASFLIIIFYHSVACIYQRRFNISLTVFDVHRTGNHIILYYLISLKTFKLKYHNVKEGFGIGDSKFQSFRFCSPKYY